MAKEKKSKEAPSGDLGQVLRIPLDHIQIGNRERVFHPEHVQELKVNIQDIGLIHPITVSEAAEGGYLLIAGRHRLEAFRALRDEGQNGYTEIPATVARAEDAKQIELCENLYRNDLSILEKAEHLDTYLRMTSDTVSETLDTLAEQAKQSKRTFYRLKAIGSGIQVADEIKKLPPEQAQELMNSTRQLYFLCKLGKKEQKEMVKILREHPELSVHQAAALLFPKEGQAPSKEKKISVRLPQTYGEQLKKLSEQTQVPEEEFAEKFFAAALAAFEQGVFQLV